MSWLQLLFGFKGRLNRKGFWQGSAICFALLLLLANVLPTQQLFQQTPTALLASALLLLVGWCFLAVVVKRLHDRGRSGSAVTIVIFPVLCYVIANYSEGMMAWALGKFLPLFFAVLLLLDWGVFRGQAEANRYGERGLALRLK
ncbi:Uncharacterized membrane protein YhaH, DUF805 family [Pasteurella testudinis DSM 23072]|uniref:Uncharacterized membrane protein YhaH, DUF805 family n=1 Tax=Pasteurella testudinis DSM 23072 TaxID=1122938 RepID=A0A1W1UFF9_9PAST|nr:DUF805 domain-containing protein [Pasteurella testudinis]SMB79524.1 Uncharacterized membrane protein YhaH, DUF805 family [Pasteurella testudinis DSM 23072]SUB50738.1 Predicted membrane protein [Pasteurella testudinis]